MNAYIAYLPRSIGCNKTGTHTELLPNQTRRNPYSFFAIIYNHMVTMRLFDTMWNNWNRYIWGWQYCYWTSSRRRKRTFSL